MAQAWRVQIGGNRFDALGRLGELHFRLSFLAESYQNLAECRLPHPHLAGGADLLGQTDGRRQRLSRFLKPLAGCQDFPL